MPSRVLSIAELTLARRAYESGATFQAIATQHGVAERTMRRLLLTLGVEPRRRGKQLIEIESPDLVLADWRGGMSCRQIAQKHGMADHRPVARFLRNRGVDVQSRPARRKVPGVVLGSAVTNRQAYLRRQPPMRIPCRTAAERQRRAWTAAELEAIAQALRAGRVQYAPRGRSGLPERPSIAERNTAHFMFWLALQKVKAAA